MAAGDCKPLLERLVARIRGWTVRSLSFAGRLQLIRSIVNGIHCYWSNHTLLPKAIVNRIEQMIRNFLWQGNNMGKGVAKVAWKIVVKPCNEGGLGIHSLSEWNRAAMAKHLWKILRPGPKSLWVKWVEENLLKGRSIWEVPVPSDCS